MHEWSTKLCHKHNQSYTINPATHLPSQAKRSESPLVLCAVSPKAAKSLDTPKLPQASLIQSFTGRRRVWEHVSLPNFHSPWVLSSATQKWAEPQECSKIVQGYSPPWSKQSNAGHELTFFLINHQESHQLPMDRANGDAPVSSNGLQGVGPDLLEHFWGQGEPWR